jgi:superfamily II DNA/RNA helicase
MYALTLVFTVLFACLYSYFNQKQPYLQPGDGPIVLVIAPTRELAVQIKVECDKFGCSSGIKNVCVYGGVPKRQQVMDLQRGVEIVIATPGMYTMYSMYITLY